MSFGIFEAAVAGDKENEHQKKLAKTRLAQAAAEVDQKLGPFLSKATSKSDYIERVRLAENDFRAIVGKYLEGDTGFKAVATKMAGHYVRTEAAAKNLHMLDDMQVLNGYATVASGLEEGWGADEGMTQEDLQEYAEELERRGIDPYNNDVYSSRRHANGETHFVHDNGVVEVFDADAYLREHPNADIATDGYDGRMWDDSVSTSWTPAPGGRSPFEYDHDYEEEEWDEDRTASRRRRVAGPKHRRLDEGAFMNQVENVYDHFVTELFENRGGADGLERKDIDGLFDDFVNLRYPNIDQGVFDTAGDYVTDQFEADRFAKASSRRRRSSRRSRRRMAAPGFDPNISDEDLLGGAQIADVLRKNYPDDLESRDKFQELIDEANRRGLNYEQWKSRYARRRSPVRRRVATPWEEGSEPQFTETGWGEYVMEYGDYSAAVQEDGSWAVVHNGRVVGEGEGNGDPDDSFGEVEQWFKKNASRGSSSRKRVAIGPPGFAVDRMKDNFHSDLGPGRATNLQGETVEFSNFDSFIDGLTYDWSQVNVGQDEAGQVLVDTWDAHTGYSDQFVVEAARITSGHDVYNHPDVGELHVTFYNDGTAVVTSPEVGEVGSIRVMPDDGPEDIEEQLNILVDEVRHASKKTAGEYLRPSDLDDNGAQNFFAQYADSHGIDTYGEDYDRIWNDIKEHVGYDVISADLDKAVEYGELSSPVGSRLQWDLEDFYGFGTGARFSSKRSRRRVANSWDWGDKDYHGRPWPDYYTEEDKESEWLEFAQEHPGNLYDIGDTLEDEDFLRAPFGTSVTVPTDDFDGEGNPGEFDIVKDKGGNWRNPDFKADLHWSEIGQAPISGLPENRRRRAAITNTNERFPGTNEMFERAGWQSTDPEKSEWLSPSGYAMYDGSTGSAYYFDPDDNVSSFYTLEDEEFRDDLPKVLTDDEEYQSRLWEY